MKEVTLILMMSGSNFIVSSFHFAVVDFTTTACMIYLGLFKVY